MWRTVVAVAAAFVIWSVLWLSYNMMLRSFGILAADETQPISNAGPLLALLIGSVVASLVAGYVATTISKSPSNTPTVILGVLLLAVGVVVQSQYWHVMPLWYHVSFLILLIPMCVLGRRLRTGAKAS